MIEKIISSACLLIIILFNVFLINRNKCGLLSPGIVFSLYWFVMGVLPFYYGFNYVNGFYLLYIEMSILAYLMGGMGFGINRSTRIKYTLVSHRVTYFGLFALFFLFVGVATFIRQQGFSLLFNISNSFSESARDISVLRYTEGVSVPVITNLSLMFGWVAISILMYSYFFNKNKAHLLMVFFIILLVIFYSALQTTKFTFMVSIFIIVSSYMVFGITSMNENKIMFSLIRNIPFIFFSFFFLFISFSMLRYAWDEFDTILVEKFIVYSGGHASGLSYYLNSFQYDVIKFDPSKFIKILSFLTDQNIEPGVYKEYIQVFGLHKTNIFTFFRASIESFGIVGSFVLSYLMGLVSAYVYKCINRGRAPAFIGVLVYLYVLLFISFIISPLLFNNITFMSILFALIFHFCIKRKIF